MHDKLNGLLEQASLLMIAAAIALGLTFVQVAELFDQMVVLFIEKPAGGDFATSLDLSPLGFRVGDLTQLLGQLLQSLIALAVVPAAGLYLVRRESRRA